MFHLHQVHCIAPRRILIRPRPRSLCPNGRGMGVRASHLMTSHSWKRRRRGRKSIRLRELQSRRIQRKSDRRSRHKDNYCRSIPAFRRNSIPFRWFPVHSFHFPFASSESRLTDDAVAERAAHPLRSCGWFRGNRVYFDVGTRYCTFVQSSRGILSLSGKFRQNKQKVILAFRSIGDGV